VSHDPSRKQFFAKLLGAAASVSVAPNLVAKTSPELSSPNGATVVSSATSGAPVVVRPEIRAVARRAGSV